MRIVKYFVSILCIVFICNLSYAHNPDEINYEVIVNEETQQLTVHFTTVSAIHLLQELRVELRMERVLKLEDYLEDFETYFNKTFILKTGNQIASFHLIKNDLYSHDATLIFSIENVDLDEDNYQIDITSFTEVFKKIKNNVTFTINNDTYNCALTKANTNCSFRFEALQKDSNYSFFYLGIPILIAMLLVFRKHKKTSVK